MTTLTAVPTPASRPLGPAVAPGDARWHAGHLFEFLATTASTGGQFALVRATCRPGFDPPRHVHANEDELWHVLEGTVTFEIGEARTVARPGDTVWSPRGIPHAFRIDSPVVRLLLLITPGGGERLFAEFSVPAERLELPPLGEHLPDFQAMGARMGELGIGIAGPPLDQEGEPSSRGRAGR